MWSEPFHPRQPGSTNFFPPPAPPGCMGRMVGFQLAVYDGEATDDCTASAIKLLMVPEWQTVDSFRSSTDPFSVISGEVFALLSLATFLQRAMMSTRKWFIGIHRSENNARPGFERWVVASRESAEKMGQQRGRRKQSADGAV